VRPRTALRVAFAVVAVGALVAATVSQWSRVADVLADVSLVALVSGAAAMAGATYCSMLAWRAVLADLGSPLGLRDAGGVFFLGQLGKYLPGSLWPVVAQMELGRDHGIPRKRSGVAALLVIVMGLTAAGLVAAVTLPFVGELGTHRWVLALPVLGLALLHPGVTRAAFRLLRRDPPDRLLSARGIALALAWSVAQWAAYGIGVWAVARGLPGAPDRLLPLATGAYALAWSAGFLFLVAPAGAGVREGALVLLLAPAYGSGPALGIALLARLLATVADLLWGLVAFARFRETVVTRGTHGQDGRRTGRTTKGGRTE
jgi:uncharacterized membrane protein YbhN (UPF0104 family)